MAEFATNVDIGNRALQHCGALRMSSFNDPSREAREVSFSYDKLRQSELRRNLWRFATRRVILRAQDTTTLQLVPAAWSAASIYIPGSVVTYNNEIYICNDWLVSGSIPDQGLPWVPYFGPLTVDLYVSGDPYFAGELVYTPENESYTVYLALADTTDTPGVYPSWDSTVVYNRGQSVSGGFSGQVEFTPGNLPVFFTPGNLPVNQQAGANYQSLRDLNVGNDPTVAAAPNWQALPPAGQPDYQTGLNWLRLDATLQSIITPYPLNAGPCSDTNTQNVYRLPNNHFRRAPADPKGGLVPALGAPAAPWPSSAVVEGVYIVLPFGHSGPMMYRFVADMTNVTLFDPMFCEGLSLRIALDVGPTLIDEKVRVSTLARIAARYREVMGEARMLDAIERGPTEPELDKYIAVRR